MTHIAAFRAQADFAPEAKIKAGKNIWTPETAGSRLYTQVLSKNRVSPKGHPPRRQARRSVHRQADPRPLEVDVHRRRAGS